MGCCSTRAQVRHAVPVVFPVDFDGGEHVYRVHSINVQSVTDLVIMTVKEERTRMWFRCCRKGRTIGSRISSLYFTTFNVPWTILSWVRPTWQIPAQTIILPPPKLSRSPDSRSLLRTVWPEIWTFARPGVLRAVSSAGIIRFWRWMRHNASFTRNSYSIRIIRCEWGPFTASPVWWRYCSISGYMCVWITKTLVS